MPIGLVHIRVRLRSAPGMVDRDPLRDRATHRHADDVRALDAEPVEDRDRIRDQVVARVARPPGRVRRRAARVAMVVADDVAPVLGEPLAEARLPAIHRGGAAHDQQHGRFRGVSEGVDAQLRAFDVNSHGIYDRRRRRNSSRQPTHKSASNPH